MKTAILLTTLILSCGKQIKKTDLTGVLSFEQQTQEVNDPKDVVASLRCTPNSTVTLTGKCLAEKKVFKCDSSGLSSVRFSVTGSCEVKASLVDPEGNTLVDVLNIESDTSSPIAINDKTSTKANTPSAPFNVLKNDSDPKGIIDLTSLKIIEGQAMGGSCSVTNERLVVFTPVNGFSGDAYCVYEICDLSKNCARAKLFVKVEESLAPVAKNDNVEMTTEDSMSVAIDVLKNDLSIESKLDPLSVIIKSSEGGNCLVEEKSGKISFVPFLGFSGKGSCLYSVSDETGKTAFATLFVNVLDKTPPVAKKDQIEVEVNFGKVEIEVLKNDSDVHSSLNPNSVKIVEGNCVVRKSSFVFFETPKDYVGKVKCLYEVSDKFGNTSSSYVAINIVDKTAPEVKTDKIIGKGSEFSVVNILENDTDNGAFDLSSLTLIESGVGGKCVPSPKLPMVSFVPTKEFSGETKCLYKVCDQSGNCTTGTIEVIGDSKPIVSMTPVLSDENPNSIGIDYSSTSVKTPYGEKLDFKMKHKVCLETEPRNCIEVIGDPKSKISQKDLDQLKSIGIYSYEGHTYADLCFEKNPQIDPDLAFEISGETSVIVGGEELGAHSWVIETYHRVLSDNNTPSSDYGSFPIFEPKKAGGFIEFIGIDSLDLLSDFFNNDFCHGKAGFWWKNQKKNKYSVYFVKFMGSEDPSSLFVPVELKNGRTHAKGYTQAMKDLNFDMTWYLNDKKTPEVKKRGLCASFWMSSYHKKSRVIVETRVGPTSQNGNILVVIKHQELDELRR